MKHPSPQEITAVTLVVVTKNSTFGTNEELKRTTIDEFLVVGTETITLSATTPEVQKIFETDVHTKNTQLPVFGKLNCLM